jgi:hypothetical protein
MQVTASPPTAPVSPGQARIAQTQSIEGLLAQRSELERQLSQLNDRRRELQRLRSNAGDAEARSLEGRIAAMDGRTVKIEDQLGQVNEQVATAMAANPQAGSYRFGAFPGTSIDGQIRRDIENAVQDAVAQGMMIGASSILGIYVLWRGFRRFVLRRKPKAAASPVIPDNTVQIQQLQHSLDTIAIEVERISEAQRFSAKLLKEKVRVE